MARKQPHPVEKLVATQERRNEALRLRMTGMTQREIAGELGVSFQMVSKYIQDAIAGITRENAEEYLALELERLDAMHAAIWRKIVKPRNDEERKSQTWLIDRALAIMDQRAKLTGSYKHAELKVIADAKGNVSEESKSMVGQMVEAFAAAYALDQQAEAAQDDE